MAAQPAANSSTPASSPPPPSKQAAHESRKEKSVPRSMAVTHTHTRTQDKKEDKGERTGFNLQCEQGEPRGRERERNSTCLLAWRPGQQSRAEQAGISLLSPLLLSMHAMISVLRKPRSAAQRSTGGSKARVVRKACPPSLPFPARERAYIRASDGREGEINFLRVCPKPTSGVSPASISSTYLRRDYCQAMRQ